MNYNYHFFKLDWPLASTLADDVLEITVRIYLERQGILSRFVSRGLVNGNIRSNETALPV
jgi:hypothetical protein